VVFGFIQSVTRRNAMVKRIILAGFLMAAVVLTGTAQSGEGPVFNVSGDLTTIYTLGNAESSQALGSGAGNGAYEDQKNGYYTNANVYLSFRSASFLEGYTKIAATHRPGSLYVPLRLEYTGASDFAVSFDTLYGKISVLEALSLTSPVNIFLKAGKFKTESSYFGRISKFETESVLYMLKTATTYNYEVEADLRNTLADGPFRVSAAFTGNFKFNEATSRLYDLDGTVSAHGQPVLGEYAPQLYASLKLHELGFLGNSKVSAELLWALNGANIYSGHSAGGSLRYAFTALPGTLTIPVGLSFGWYQKNIDILSGTADTAQDRATTDMREALSFGYAAGARFSSGPIAADMNIAGAVSSIGHIYRDTLTIASLSLDAQFTYNNTFFVGGGVIFGTLGDAEWKTSASVSAALDGGGYTHTFSLPENLGYEVYGGVKFPYNCRVIVGFNQNKGLAMNYTLESRPDGQIKYKQAGTAAGDSMLETGGLFIKFGFSF
jgi:hypothetical protein